MPATQAIGVGVGAISKLLDGVAPRDRDHMLGAATLRRVSAGTVITTQGAPAERLYVLMKGCSRYFYDTPDGRKILLIWMAPGDIFGVASLVAKPTQYLVSTEAVKDCELLAWDRATIRGYTQRFPRIMENALTLATEYLTWALTAHVTLSCHTARERLTRVLLGLSRAIGEKVPDGIEIDVTNEELASAAHITPYTTSRLMSDLRKNKAITKRRGKVVLRSPERLHLGIV